MAPTAIRSTATSETKPTSFIGSSWITVAQSAPGCSSEPSSAVSDSSSPAKGAVMRSLSSSFRDAATAASPDRTAACAASSPASADCTPARALFDTRAGAGYPGLGGEPLLDELRCGAVGDLGLLEPRAGLGHPRLGLGDAGAGLEKPRLGLDQLDLAGARVDLAQELAFLHAGAPAKGRRDDLTRCFGPHVDLARRLGLATDDDRAVDLGRARPDGDDPDPFYHVVLARIRVGDGFFHGLGGRASGGEGHHGLALKHEEVERRDDERREEDREGSHAYSSFPSRRGMSGPPSRRPAHRAHCPLIR
jgi:hypothetical protein